MQKFFKLMILSAVFLTTGGTSLLFSSPAYAFKAGVTCSTAYDDEGFGDNGVDKAANHRIASNSCGSSNSWVSAETKADSRLSIHIFFNSRSDSEPSFLNNFMILYALPVEKMMINGEPYESGQQMQITDVTEISVQYEYGSSTSHFTTKLDTKNHSISRFKIEDGAL